MAYVELMDRPEAGAQATQGKDAKAAAATDKEGARRGAKEKAAKAAA
jgi:hypothetical protein